MIRKVLLSGMAALGLASPLALTGTADAHPLVIVHRHVEYEVIYRTHHHWHCYGTYCSRYEADRAAHHLRHRGYDVRIEIR